MSTTINEPKLEKQPSSALSFRNSKPLCSSLMLEELVAAGLASGKAQSNRKWCLDYLTVPAYHGL